MLREMNIFLKTNITFFKNGVDLRKNQVESKFHVWNVIAIFARLKPEIFLGGAQRGGGVPTTQNWLFLTYRTTHSPKICHLKLQ